MEEQDLSVRALIHVLLEEADLIDELRDAVVEQRESVKNGDYVTMQDLMKRVQDTFFHVQAQEAQRVRLADSAAKKFGCEPRISALSQVVPEEERALFRGSGERLGHSIFALKSEMTILSGLIEQNERFSAMLLSEWRRLDAGFIRSGGLDFRG
ncbi:MAG: flagellar protein FlgN [Synergistaceae bacterium]|nr:flagellar protein FlgN [Synergistaceae bacterium]